MKKRKKNQKSTLLRVLETMCGILFAFALMLLIWDIQLKKSSITMNSDMNAIPSTPYVNTTDAPNLRIDQNATSDGPPETEIEGISIPGLKEITISSGKETVAIDLYNPEQNIGKYYLRFELKVPDAAGVYETLFVSDLVEGGKHLYRIRMNHSLPAGTYNEAILHIQPYTVENLTPTNNADVKFTLFVE